MLFVYVLTVEHPTDAWGVMGVADSFHQADYALHGDNGVEPYGGGRVEWDTELDDGPGRRVWTGKSGSRRFSIWERELIVDE